MSFAWKDKPISREGLLSRATIESRAIILALVRWSVQVRPVGGILIVIVVAFLLTAPQIPTASAEPPELNPLEDCVSCHTKTLKFHNKLGSGNQGCWVCHDRADMGMLRLVDETKLPLPDSSQLCAQCHQKRYVAWKEGTHGIPAWEEGVPGIPGADKAECVGCHDPHQPQIALLDITKPHPAPQPPPSPPSDELLVLLAVSLLLTIGVVVAVAQIMMKAKQP